jgi:hypothetical protein
MTMQYNKRSLIISIIALALGLTAFTVFFVLFIKSSSLSGKYGYEKNDGTTIYEWDITFNQNYAMGFILGILLISYGAYALYKVLKENKSTDLALFVSLSVGSGLVGVYSFQVFFKELVRCLFKGKEFIYLDFQMYLYMAIIFLTILIVSLVFAIKYVKKHKISIIKK